MLQGKKVIFVHFEGGSGVIIFAVRRFNIYAEYHSQHAEPEEKKAGCSQSAEVKSSISSSGFLNQYHVMTL